MYCRSFSSVFLPVFIAISVSCVSCHPGVSGNGDVVTAERETGPFDRLEIAGIFNIFISQGPKESLRIEADENLHQLVETTLEEGKLFIGWKDSLTLSHAEKLDLYVTVRDLNRLVITGVGETKTTSPLNLENIALEISGVGSTDLEIYCKKADADFTTVGDISLRGSADEMRLAVSGAGNLSAFGFVVKRLFVNASGIGNAEVHAEEEISISSTGIGNLFFAGNAAVKKMEVSGIGKVRKKQ